MVLEVVGVVLYGGCGFPRCESPRAAEVGLVECERLVARVVLAVVLLVVVFVVGGWEEERVFFRGLLEMTWGLPATCTGLVVRIISFLLQQKSPYNFSR